MAFATTTFAQTNSFEAAFDTLQINEQFEHLYRRSNTFEEYKVISISGYNLLKKNSQDSIPQYKQDADSHLQEITSLKNSLTSTNTEIEKLQQELASIQQAKNSMSFIGIEVSKGAYNAIMWGIIICLAIVSVVLFSLFKRGHHVVKDTKNRLLEVQEDLETLRKNALVREQKLARELMDFKLKNKSSR
jgi:preprotein translocase subunit SecF